MNSLLEILPNEKLIGFEVHTLAVHGLSRRFWPKCVLLMLGPSDAIVRSLSDSPNLYTAGKYHHMRFGTKITDGIEQKEPATWHPIGTRYIDSLEKAISVFTTNSPIDTSYKIRPHPFRFKPEA
jgi:hypothetical protein